MTAEAGHAANRAYRDQSGNFHLNGASFFNDAETDIAGALESLAVWPGVIRIPVYDLRSTTGVPLTAAETQGNFNIDLTSNVALAQGEVTDNETEASVVNFQFALPSTYNAGDNLTITLPVAIIATAAAVNNGSTIDINAYRSLAIGTVGADICATAAQTFAALDTWYAKAFVITGTTLGPGDTLNVKITSSVIDSEAGAGTLRLNMDAPLISLNLVS